MIFLRGGPRSWREIKSALLFSANTLRPQIPVLIEEGLVAVTDGKYSLTDYGHTIMLSLHPAIDNIAVLEKYEDFWKNHLLRVIPDELLARINELEGAQVVTTTNGEVYEPRLLSIIKSASSINAIASMIHPSYPAAFLAAAERGIPITVVVGKHVYERLVLLHPDEISRYIQCPGAELYVCDYDLKISMMVTDTLLSVTLPYASGDVDPARDLVSTAEPARHWGEDLFAWYRVRAVKKN